MVICIDSCVFIRGITRPEADTQRLFELIGPALRVVISRLVAVEVTRNLSDRTQQAAFYRLFYKTDNATIIEEPVPLELIEQYIALGLPEKGDAIIGAFAEWLAVDYLISDNRHFLRHLRTEAYRLLTPAGFLEAIESL